MCKGSVFGGFKILTVLTKIELFRISHLVDWSLHKQSFGGTQCFCVQGQWLKTENEGIVLFQNVGNSVS